jgi:hypothetical protein
MGAAVKLILFTIGPEGLLFISFLHTGTYAALPMPESSRAITSESSQTWSDVLGLRGLVIPPAQMDSAEQYSEIQKNPVPNWVCLCWAESLSDQIEICINMTIRFTDDITLDLAKTLEGKRCSKRRFERGDVCEAEFLGHDNDVTTIDLEMADGKFALGVPFHVVEVLARRD